MHNIKSLAEKKQASSYLVNVGFNNNVRIHAFVLDSNLTITPGKVHLYCPILKFPIGEINEFLSWENTHNDFWTRYSTDHYNVIVQLQILSKVTLRTSI